MIPAPKWFVALALAAYGVRRVLTSPWFYIMWLFVLLAWHRWVG